MPTRRDVGQQQCLVCSLVARQARTMLERNSVVRLPSGAGSTKTASKKQTSPSSFAIDVPAQIVGEANGFGDSSEEFMPPPPPRPASTSKASAYLGSLTGISLRQQLSMAYTDPSLACITQDESSGSFDTAERQYKLHQASVARGRDRSLSINRESLSSKKSGLCMTSFGMHRRRRSASVGCIPSVVAAAACGTIDEEDVMAEQPLDLPE